jgi:hypothetical protein
MRNVSDKRYRKKSEHILCSIASFRKPCLSRGNVEKHGGYKQATDDNIIRRMRFACPITKATQTQARDV